MGVACLTKIKAFYCLMKMFFVSLTLLIKQESKQLTVDCNALIPDWPEIRSCLQALASAQKPRIIMLLW